MDRFVVLVNGLPGAGKTTLARPLAAALELPLLCKDAVKETLAGMLGLGPDDADGRRAWSHRLGAAAMEAIWTVLETVPGGAVVEANLLTPTRPNVLAGMARAGIDPRAVTEVWCDVPADLARERFEARAPLRHAIHGPQVGLGDMWVRWSAQAEPLGVGRVVRVDSTRPVDVSALARELLTSADTASIMG